MRQVYLHKGIAHKPVKLADYEQTAAYAAIKQPINQFRGVVNDREAVKMLYAGTPVHQVCGTAVEYHTFCPSINPDNIARAYVLDATTRPDKKGQAGGPDMFGIEWEYVRPDCATQPRTEPPLCSKIWRKSYAESKIDS